MKINQSKTSARCSICGGIIPEENRQIRCQCGRRKDRSFNAACIPYEEVDLQLRGPWLRPDAPQVEAVKQSKDAEQIVVSYLPKR